MEEAKQTKPGAGSDDTSTQNAARQDEATSSDTLSDLGQTQTDSAAAQSGTSGASDSNSAPAPDGMPDTTSGESGDGRDSGGPM
jgi:hypothetical protein